MNSPEKIAVELSIGLLAWNEEESIGVTLRSLFDQTLFGELLNRGTRCEVIVVANGCTDQTAQIATETLRQFNDDPVLRTTVVTRVADVPQRGKPNAWNRFVHEFSSPSARCLFILDADIVFSTRTTLSNMLQSLREHPDATVVVDHPQKDISFKQRKSLADYFSLATSSMTQRTSAQLTGQLYGIRAERARLIYLPRELMVEDGFIKALVCTDGLTAPSNPSRIVQAADAGHIFEAYTSPSAVLRNQKRQIIGQTQLHVLLDKELKGLMKEHQTRPPGGLATLLKERDEQDPVWLRRIVNAHLRERRRFWQMFPGIATFRLKRWMKLRGMRKFAYLPAALAGTCVTLISCWLASRFLRRGFETYWPDTRSPGLTTLQPLQVNSEPLAINNASTHS